MGSDADGLRSFGEARGVRTLAYGFLGEPWPSKELTDHPTLVRIGTAHGRSVEQVALRWLLQSGVAASVRPSSPWVGVRPCAEGAAECAAGLRARAASFGWALTEAEMAALDALTLPFGKLGNPTLFSSTGCPGSLLG